jgi:hypothetical protein
MMSTVGSIPYLLGAPRYSTKRNRFVFAISGHEVFVAAAVDPRLCADWQPEAKVSYGECLTMIALRREEVELSVQALLSGEQRHEDSRIDLWQPPELEDAF